MVNDLFLKYSKIYVVINIYNFIDVVKKEYVLLFFDICKYIKINFLKIVNIISILNVIIRRI